MGRRLASTERHAEIVLRHGPGLTVDGGGTGVAVTGEEDGVVLDDRHTDVDRQIDPSDDGVRRRIDECGGGRSPPPSSLNVQATTRSDVAKTWPQSMPRSTVATDGSLVGS